MSTVTVPQLMQKSVEKWRVLGVAILVALSLVGGVFNQDAFVLRLFEGSLPILTSPVHTELIDFSLDGTYKNFMVLDWIYCHDPE
jgi:hypothetical protein